MHSSNTGLRNNRDLLKDKKHYIKNSDDFFDRSKNNQEQSSQECKVFENKMNEEERIIFLNKLERQTKMNVFKDRIIIILIVVSVVFGLVYLHYFM